MNKKEIFSKKLYGGLNASIDTVQEFWYSPSHEAHFKRMSNLFNKLHCKNYCKIQLCGEEVEFYYTNMFQNNLGHEFNLQWMKANLLPNFPDYICLGVGIHSRYEVMENKQI